MGWASGVLGDKEKPSLTAGLESSLSVLASIGSRSALTHR
jgi:hypothetical protein